jgi:3-hydroxyisobutyrate dehydrogenase-like beta-hydroxyacid dehydrogenase
MKPTIAVVAQGAMGSAVGGRLVEHGLTVLTSLAGRSAASAKRAQAAGLETVSDQATAAADLFLSIVPPGDALALAERLAPHLTGKSCVYVDCNAVSPKTKQAIAAVIAKTGCPFIDVGIVGGPPKPGYGPAFYASGEAAARLAPLGQYGLDVRVMEGPVGAAAALKMSYAGITKGLTAIGAAMMLAATRAGAGPALRHELALSQPALLAWLSRQLPASYAKAYRWVAEMEEIAEFAGDAPTHAMYDAVAEFYVDLAKDFDAKREQTQALTAFLDGALPTAAE